MTSGQALAGDRVEVRSARSAPGEAVNPAAVRAMAEAGAGVLIDSWSTLCAGRLPVPDFGGKW